MRLSTDVGRDETTALATLAAALDAGVALFDAARAYAIGEHELGHNERLLARAWRAAPTPPRARVVTKCGMRRDGGAWIPDGRAKSIAEDVAASLEAMDGVPRGPPVCWCRPPLPGLLLAFSRRQGVDLRASTLVGSTAVDRRLAGAVGMTFVAGPSDT